MQSPLEESRLETRVDWLHAPEAWVIFLIVIPAALLIVGTLYRGELRRAPAWKAAILTMLRTAALLAVGAFLCEPILVREQVRKQNSHILVLVDDSFSMGIADRYGDDEQRVRLETVLGAPLNDQTTRLELVRGLLASDRLKFIERLREKGNVRVVSFSNELKTVCDLPRHEAGAGAAPTDVLPNYDAIEARGKVTRIGDALYEAVNELRGETVSAVVLLSDGRDTGGILTPEEAADRLHRREIPIHAVGVGNAEEPKDIRVFNLDIAEVILERDKVPVDVNIVSRGFSSGEQIPVQLKLIGEDGSVPTRPDEIIYVRLEDLKEQTVRIEFTPRRPGKFLARVEVPVQDGELFKENNYVEKPVTVLSQKINVLYVDGRPRWEYRYLSHALTRDPTMETHVLLTSSDPERLQLSSSSLTPIDAFPTSREELFKYHVLVIGDVHPDTFSAEQKAWIVELVDDIGGGVVFVSGARYMPQKYRGDPLETLFPVVLEDIDRSGYEATSITNDFALALTVEGRTHPILQLVGDNEENAALWADAGRKDKMLPGFYWYAQVKKLTKGAVALATHPLDRNFKQELRPVFAYQFLGRGRTFVSLTDETWRWRRGVGNKYFYRFWGQVVRFVSTGRLLGQKQRFSVSTDQRDYPLGSTVRILARVLDEKFKPLRDESYPVLYERGDATERARNEVRAVQVPGRPEYFEVAIEARELGEHKVWIEHLESEAASTTYRVLVPQVEYQEPRMDQARLQKIARLSSGSYHDLAQAEALLDKVQPYQLEVAVPAESTPLWDRWGFIVALVSLLAVEWILRKVFRLV
ncbi:MAG: VWA domain-containing protein [Planctomycetota bacterium]